MRVEINTTQNITGTEDLLIQAADQPASGLKKTEYADKGFKVIITTLEVSVNERATAVLYHLEKLIDDRCLSDEVVNLLFDAKISVMKAQLKLNRGE